MKLPITSVLFLPVIFGLIVQCTNVPEPGTTGLFHGFEFHDLLIRVGETNTEHSFKLIKILDQKAVIVSLDGGPGIICKEGEAVSTAYRSDGLRLKEIRLQERSAVFVYSTSIYYAGSH